MNRKDSFSSALFFLPVWLLLGCVLASAGFTAAAETIPRPEYPKPQFRRDTWLNLNGAWAFAFDFENQGLSGHWEQDPAKFDKKILVPFCPESKLSGIHYTDFIPAVWYRRTFTLPESWRGKRVFLHFGAVDYETRAWVNGKPVGRHWGGTVSFEFEITQTVKPGENVLVVYAFDDVRSELQPSGKQSRRRESYGVMYTRTTGIWQTVWLEARPQRYLRSVHIVPELDNHRFVLTPVIAGDGQDLTFQATLLAADGKLFAVTLEGRIYAFGGQERARPAVHAKPTAAPPKAGVWTRRAAGTLQATGVTDGYAVVLGIGSGRMATELARQSQCRVIAIDPDAAKVAKLRASLHQAGLYGTRISIRVGDPMTYPLPPYLASLVVSEDTGLLGAAPDRVLAAAVVHCLRPYGGAARLWFPADRRERVVQAVNALGVAGVAARLAGPLVAVTRGGALPGAGNWSHPGANAANTGACEDDFLKPPLALLWFSGAARWSRIPHQTVVRVAGGRLLVKAGKLHALDIFTGRQLWQAPLPQPFGKGAEFVAAADAVYIAGGKSCTIVDPATGKERAKVELPPEAARPLSSVRVSGHTLVGASGNDLLCIDLRSRKLAWRVQRPRPIGAIVLGGGKVFCADRIVVRKGKPVPPHPDARIQAFDLATGKPLWEAPGASELRYSKALDLLLAASGVYRGADGTRVRDGATGRIAGDKLLAGQHDGFVAHDLRTGDKSLEKPLQWARRGCTSLRASTHLLTTRYKGNAAYIDVATRRITSLWNIRAACSNNLFPANGILNVPNLTGGCTCNYLPVSQAFVPVWTLARPGANE